MSSEYAFFKSQLFYALIKAIKKGSLDKVEELLAEYPCLLGMREGAYADTPLHTAVRENQAAIVSSLIDDEKAASLLSIKNKAGQTPLELAQSGGFQEIAIALETAEKSLNSTEFSPEEQKIISQHAPNFFCRSNGDDLQKEEAVVPRYKKGP